MRDRYWQCDETCTTDCGACKGSGPPAGDRISCRHPFGCQAPGEGCIGPCPVSAQEAATIEREAFTGDSAADAQQRIEHQALRDRALSKHAAQTGERIEPVGLSDQQQAAEVLEAWAHAKSGGGSVQDRIAAALAAARAEEAARWQAKIEEVAKHWDDGTNHGRWVAQDLRALLDGER